MKDLDCKNRAYRNNPCCDYDLNNDFRSYTSKSPSPDKCRTVKTTPNVINNINTCFDKENCNNLATGNSCAPVELIRNGGFEELGIQTVFANWNDETEGLDINLQPSTSITYEGRQSANFDIDPVPGNTTDRATLTQTVSVNPGCYLTLSFAERLAEKPVDIEIYFSAEVFYISGSNEVELIKIEKIVPRAVTVEASAFSYHEKTSDIPVPQNVDFVIVRFTVSLNTINASNDDTDLYLDGVSLRASR
jgi:hypothetical protein